MALKNRETEGAELPKPPTETPGSKPDNNGTRAPRVNEDVEKRLNPYIEANKEAMERYTKLVKENPERAIETFLYRDQQKHESEMRLIEKQLPQARTFYNAQTADAKARIDRDLEGVNPYFKDKAFVNAALREKDRQTRREFANPATSPATPPPAAAARVAA